MAHFLKYAFSVGIIESWRQCLKQILVLRCYPMLMEYTLICQIWSRGLLQHKIRVHDFSICKIGHMS